MKGHAVCADVLNKFSAAIERIHQKHGSDVTPLVLFANGDVVNVDERDVVSGVFHGNGSIDVLCVCCGDAQAVEPERPRVIPSERTKDPGAIFLVPFAALRDAAIYLALIAFEIGERGFIGEGRDSNLYGLQAGTRRQCAGDRIHTRAEVRA
jgi:hypothetical protein